MSHFHQRTTSAKLMATLFVEYRDSGKKDANGRAILRETEECVLTWRDIQSRLG